MARRETIIYELLLIYTIVTKMSETKAPRPRNVLMGEFEGLSKEDASQALRDSGGDLDRARALVRRRCRGAVSYTHLTLPTILLV